MVEPSSVDGGASSATTSGTSNSNSRRQRRAVLLKLNYAAWNGQTDIFPTAKSLDLSLKKNTAFIKRLRTSISAESQDALLKEIASLSLEKYLSEVISAAAEGLARCRLTADIWAAVEVVSALHQRFALSFTPLLVLYLLRGFANPTKTQLAMLTPEQRDKEDSARILRQRGLIRLVTEFWLCGIARTSDDARKAAESAASSTQADSAGSNAQKSQKKAHSASAHSTSSRASISGENAADPIPLEILKELLSTDTKDFFYLQLAAAFVKNYGPDVLGSARKPADESSSANIVLVGAGATDGDGLVDDTLRKRFRAVVESYYSKLSEFLVRQHNAIKDQEKRNNAAYMRSGEIFEDRQSTFEKMVKDEEKMVANTQIIADALDLDMPDLAHKEKEIAGQSAQFSFTKGGAVSADDLTGNGLWEDEEQRKFYEDLLDLKSRVPDEYFESGKKTISGDSHVDLAANTLDTETSDDAAMTAVDDELVVVADIGDSSSAPSQSLGSQVESIILRLTDMNNRESIDQVALDFCFLNSKASRNRLARSLESVPKARQDLLPMYSRLIATLNRYIPEIGTAVVLYLQKEFKSLQRRRPSGGVIDRGLAESRALNIRYISELVKFKIVPNHIAFNCLKVLTDGFGRNEIESLSNMLESCGRFLLRSESTRDTMADVLQIVWKKKSSAQNLDSRDRILLENAFYYVNPPEQVAITQKQRPVVEQYVRKLVYVDLSKNTYHHVWKQLKKLHWSDPETRTAIDNAFTKIWKVKYSNISLMALIASSLMKYQQYFIVRLVDSVLEQIRVGLELNMFRYNQQRIAQVKFLAELYNYRVVDSGVVFDTLYTIVGFGHEGGRPQPGRATMLDPADDYFRIRLVCTILDACGSYFDRGSAKRKLALFLAFFQYYVYTKIVPLPMDIEFTLHDTLQMLRPQLKVCTSLEEAAAALADAMTTAFGDIDLNNQNHEEEELEQEADELEDEDEEEDEEEEGEDEDDVVVAIANGNEVSSGDSDNTSDDGDDEDDVDSDADSDDADSDEGGSSSGRSRRGVVDDEFDREFSRMVAESIESRKAERKAAFDVPLPMMRNSTSQQQQHHQQNYSVLDMTKSDDHYDAYDDSFPATTPQSSTVAPSSPQNVQFRLLTKRGNRQLVHVVDVPADSAMAVSTLMKQKAEREERQRIKKLVLNYERSTGAG
ncbi:armadillo-type protein [Limtongia smithiae]|uniref:armadillo-type protein n=1 Tax=Limtongia smithiae TaxID=1125753 RepID=UPI0034CDE991